MCSSDKSKLMMIVLSFILITTVLLNSETVYAQSPGRIVGQVVDAQSGTPLVGVNVLIVGTTMGAATDSEGYYHIINIRPGEYTVRFSMIGYSTQVIERVPVHINETFTLDIRMQEEAILGEEIVVVAERPTVKLDMSSSRHVLGVESIEASPVQSFEEILSSLPGINLTAGEDGSGFIVRGGGINETNIVVDGISTRDRRSQQPNTTINLTAIEEVEIISGGFNAEYGGIRSGLINVATRDGRLDRYNLALDVRISPPQRKHFGPSPFSMDGPFWQVYAGPDAFTGITQEMVDAGLYPFTFIGWNEIARQFLSDGNPDTDMTPQEALEVWKYQHRPVSYANKPDYIFDGTLSGRLPLTDNVSFMLSQRYEDLQLVYPMSRNNSIASSTLLNVITRPKSGMRLAFLNAFTVNKGVSSGPFSHSYGMITGTRQGGQYARNAPNWRHLWHDATYNPIETYQYRGGISLNHVLSPNTFYQVVAEYNNYRTKQEPMSLRDTTCVQWIGNRCYDDEPFGYVGTPLGRGVSETWDILDQFLMGGGGRGRDNSYYWGAGVKFDITSRITRFNEVKAGIELQYSEQRERREINHEASTLPYEERPQYWVHYDARPIEISAYLQNRFEWRDMIANFGIRLDYLNPQQRPYNIDPEYIFSELPYKHSEFMENELSFAHLQLDESASKLYLSPRLGVSHPITQQSKIFFNYGHFYQPPITSQLYTVQPQTVRALIPNLNIEWPRTVSYEVGFEVSAGYNMLVTFTGYYKDVTNQISQINIVSWDRDNDVQTFANNSYADIRGVELRIARLSGEWMYGWIATEYSTRSTGLTGYRYIYENPLLSREQRSAIVQTRSVPRPSITANLTFRTPRDFGPTFAGLRLFGGWRLNVLQRWSDGGERLMNPDDLYQNHRYAKVIDYWMTDVQLMKDFTFSGYYVGFGVQVTNLFNYRGIPRAQDMRRYYDSLRFPWMEGERKGNDKVGDWKADHIDLGYHTWNQWLNPRHISLNVRVNL